MYKRKNPTPNISLILPSVMDKRCIYSLQEPEFNWEKEYPTYSYKKVLNYKPSYRSFKLCNLKIIQSRRQNAIILRVIY